MEPVSSDLQVTATTATTEPRHIFHESVKDLVQEAIIMPLGLSTSRSRNRSPIDEPSTAGVEPAAETSIAVETSEKDDQEAFPHDTIVSWIRKMLPGGRDGESADSAVPSIWGSCCGGQGEAAAKPSVVSRVLQKCMSVVMALLLTCASFVLFTVFITTLIATPLHGLLWTAVYLFCSTMTYYLEGGQAARFMAKGMPLSALKKIAPIGRRFLAADNRDQQSIMTYMGVRQFLTLGVTTCAGAVVIPRLNTEVIQGVTGLGQDEADVVVIVMHLLFTTTLCQVLPQIRAEKNLAFLENIGTLFTFYACALLGKVIDPSLAAQYIHLLLDCISRAAGRCCTTNSNTSAPTAAMNGLYQPLLLVIALLIPGLLNLMGSRRRVSPSIRVRRGQALHRSHRALMSLHGHSCRRPTPNTCRLTSLWPSAKPSPTQPKALMVRRTM